MKNKSVAINWEESENTSHNAPDKEIIGTKGSSTIRIERDGVYWKLVSDKGSLPMRFTGKYTDSHRATVAAKEYIECLD